MSNCPDAIVRRVIRAALAAADPAPLVQRALTQAPELSPLRSASCGLLLAVGKAAGAMLDGAYAWAARPGWSALAVTKDGHPVPAWAEARWAAHPLPDARSLSAAEELLTRVAALPAGAGLLLLLSGGASSLLCAPRPPLSWEEKRAISHALLSRGAPIQSLNAVRRALSRLKGGGLLRAAPQATCAALLLSDVVGGAPRDIGSGPLWPDPADAPRALAVLAQYQLLGSLPGALQEELQHPAALAPSPPPHLVLGDRRCLLQGASAALAAEGILVQVLDEALTGPVDAMIARFQAAPCGAGPRALLAVGEPTLDVRGDGLGGRAQHAALLMARALAGQRGVSFLALASDGTDGPTTAAGGLVDGDTWDAISRAGLDPAEALSRFDSYHALGAAGARLDLGPSGTNVNDLYLLWRR